MLVESTDKIFSDADVEAVVRTLKYIGVLRCGTFDSFYSEGGGRARWGPVWSV